VNFSGKQNVQLRDERKAWHFWIDNEVADCYQPIVGADAVWVYCRIARYAHGAWIVSPRVRGNDTRVSLREMAGWCGKSPDTVWRCLQVLEHVGLLYCEHGTRSAGRYALADVKDLVMREGGQYDRVLGAWVLPQERAVQLAEEVHQLRTQMARKKTVADWPSSVAQSDRLSGQLFSVPVAQSDKTVAPEVQICRSGATASLFIESKKARTSTTPPNPLASEGGVADGGEGDEAFGKHLQSRRDGRGTGGVQAARLGAVPGVAVSRVVLGNVVAANSLPAEQKSASDAASASSAADLAQVADTRSAAEHSTAFADVSDGRRCGLGHDGDAVVANELTPEQLEHLDACHPAMRAEFERYYREENAKAAKVTHKADAVPAPALEFADTAAARAWVMRECGYVENRRRRGVGPVIEAALQTRTGQGETLGALARRMVDAVRKHEKLASRLRYQYGPARFIELGLWLDENKWPWDYKEIERQQARAF